LNASAIASTASGPFRLRSVNSARNFSCSGVASLLSSALSLANVSGFLRAALRFEGVRLVAQESKQEAGLACCFYLEPVLGNVVAIEKRDFHVAHLGGYTFKKWWSAR